MSRKRAATPIAGFAVLLVFCSFAFGADPPQDREPPLLLYLEAEGRRISIELDKPFDLAALSGKKTATLIIEEFAGAKTRELATELALKGRTLKGRRLEITLANTVLLLDLFSFASGENSIVLSLQVAPEAGGKPSADRARAEKMLCETLRLPAE